MRFTFPASACGVIGIAAVTACSGGSFPAERSADATSGTTASASRSAILQNGVLPPGTAKRRFGTPVRPFIDAKAIASVASVIAVSDGAGDVVDVYDSSGKLLARLGGYNGPVGMTSDIGGELFVADDGDRSIKVYAPGFKGPPKSIDVSNADPVGVDTFQNGKIVAVANLFAEGPGQGNIEFFERRKLVNTVTDSRLYEAFFCAFDATGNLYVAGLDAHRETVIGEIVGGVNGHSFTPLSTDNTIAFPGAVQVTTSGQIAIGDQLGLAIYTYDPPTGSSLGSPVATTPLKGSSDPVSFTFTNDMSSLYTADAGSAASNEYAYAAGGSPLATIPVGGQPVGTAIVPTQFPKP